MDDTQMDRALAAWGQSPMADEGAVGRLVAHAEALAQASAAKPPRRGWVGWATGGALAASVALALLLAPSSRDAMPPPAAAVPASGDPSASFAMLYSPTAEEEALL